MKKLKYFLTVMKNILMAIMLGGIIGNIFFLMEFLPPIADEDAPLLLTNDYVPRIIIVTAFSWLSFYFLFMRRGRTVYSVMFLSSEYFLGWISIRFWWNIFEASVTKRELLTLEVGF